ncbi:MAG: hypothetical protein ACPGYX_07365 [Oceanobacter sp.]
MVENQKALNTGELARRSAHALCELAELSLAESAFLDVTRLCRKAIRQDSGCARSHVILAKMAGQQEEFNEAIRCYLKAFDISPELLVPMLDPVVSAFQNLGDSQGMEKYLKRYNHQVHNSQVSQALAASVFERFGVEEAAKVILEECREHPSYEGAWALLQLILQAQDGGEETGEVSLTREAYDILTDILDQEPRYLCRHCGFKAQDFHWRCPSCKDWATQIPYLNRPQFSGSSSFEML